MSLAPPAAKDGFSYAGDSIYVEASGHNRHRRATIPELKAHFKGSSDVKDPPAHWYEAQLLHYGLPPSKAKGTAKMRLVEAVSKGKIAVPAHIQKLETDLKKEWTKSESEAKKALKPQAIPASATKGTKRKADTTVVTATNINLNLSFSVNSAGSVQIQSAVQPKKKAKIAGSSTAEKAPKQPVKAPASTAKKAPVAKIKEQKTSPAVSSKAVTTKSTPASKATKISKPKESKAANSALKVPNEKADRKTPRKPQTARRGGATAGNRTKTSGQVATPSSSKAPPLPCTKQTARRGGTSAAGNAKGPSRAGQQPSHEFSHTPVKMKQTALRGGMQGGGRATIPSASFGTTEDYDEPPPPYTEFPDENLDEAANGNSEDEGYDDEYSDLDRDGMDVEDDYDGNDSEEELAPLGLLNGRYDIECSALSAASQDLDVDSGLILTLDGNSLWGSFDICGINGIFRLPERPWQSSHEGLRIAWRGNDDEGNTFRGDDHRGDIWFLGGGRIKGEILSEYDGWYEFHGQRISGQETRSEISAWSMRQQWDELDW
ncbi:hypothetical protein UCRPA7_4164 [Phaeoacremonium minimum UCRPA7]|uniref:Uncharacterized protein n=1 Tax=Phaeoacremonium minimum (strain UCR-PA7) TaxID=1286976 RepID=R8BLV1_PHAM7|nr:hypothetical protein UCRPA7_4164 [Phaeoacremonium minimum UCRPA7]EOO00338.1 hypothetical protein UCRPA7_4164 [Phaeoacremonium minimum UCRPA7]